MHRVAPPLLALVLAGCALETADAGDEDVGEAEAALRRHGYNPVLPNCADPGVTRHGGRWYAVCTGARFPLYVSTNLTRWTRLGTAFPEGGAPRWAEGHHWAPEIHHVPGGFALYFSALYRGRHVIGAAFSERPEGPYVDRGSPLLAWRTSLIDAHVTRAGRRLYLFFKAERTRGGAQADVIYVRPLARSGLSLGRGRTRVALRSTRAWEDGVVEAPWVIRRGGWFYLFYSGSYYCNGRYAVGVARRRGDPYGPFRPLRRPIQRSGHRWRGPGHNAITTGPDGRRYMLFHAYDRREGTPRCAESGPDNDARHMLVRRVVFRNGWPRTATGAPSRRAPSAFVGTGAAPAGCTDDLGRTIAAGESGIVMCDGGTARCTCASDGHFEGCGPCVPE